ncbi:MAG: SIS domain-containing protein [bacterium]
MYEVIKNFEKQFLYEPEIENKKALVRKSSIVVVGMGGSALAPKLLKTWDPGLDITVYSDYGLPKISKEELKNKLIILSSYSGNTEEVTEAFKEVKAQNLNMAVISTGGTLLALAIENKVPYIKLPDTGIQPRSALGFSVKAFLKIIGKEDELKNITKLATSLKPIDYEKAGKSLALAMKDYIPVIYSSSRNFSVAYNWKIKLNETGKIPAFYNVLPELNHNEMNGFDVKDSTKELDSKFYFIVLKDSDDNPKILKRMKILEKLYKDRKFPVQSLDIKGKDMWHKIFSSLVLADWVAYYTATQYGLESEQVPMVEEFKKLISR